MKQVKHKGYSQNFALKFILIPILFFIIAYLLIFAAMFPLVKPLRPILDMLFLNNKPSISSDYTDLMVSAVTSHDDSSAMKASEITLPEYGARFGTLAIEGTEVSCSLFFGDSNKELKNGVGIYNGSFVPGYGRTILVAGHNNTFFNDLQSAKVGSKINVTTNYGQYVYEITQTKITTDTDTSAYDLSKQEENIVLYTCYPFDTLGLTPQRYFVYGKYVSGPEINMYE